MSVGDLVNLDAAGFADPLRAQVLADSVIGCGPSTSTFPGTSGFPDTADAALCATFASIGHSPKAGFLGLADFRQSFPPGSSVPYSYVMYDCESWAITPQNEQHDPYSYAAQGVGQVSGLIGPGALPPKFIAAPALDLLPGLPGYNSKDGYVVNYESECKVAANFCAQGIDVLHLQCQKYADDPGTLIPFFNKVARQVTNAGHSQRTWQGLCTYKLGKGSITLPDQLQQDWSGAPAPRYWINVPSPDHQAPQHVIQFFEMQYGWAPVTRLVQVNSVYTTESVTTQTVALSQATKKGNTLLVAVTNDSGIISSVQMNGRVYTFTTDYKPAGNVTAHLSHARLPAGVTTVRVTISRSRANWGFTIFEVAGLASAGTAAVVDRANSANLSGQTSWRLDPYNGGTPVTPNEFIVGIIHNSSGTGGITVTGDWVAPPFNDSTRDNVTAYRDTPTGLASADTNGPDFQGTAPANGDTCISAVAYRGGRQVM